VITVEPIDPEAQTQVYGVVRDRAN
jgi:hypothetical protein